MKTKRCKVCQKILPLSDFDKNQYNKAGEVIRRSQCKSCRSYKKRIPSRVKKDFEFKHPRPQIGMPFTCPICKKKRIVESTRDIALDHDHKTGIICGYLCHSCNTGMGNFNDDISRLKRAIQWLSGKLNL